MSKTEHLGDPHPKTWKNGATCDTCQAAHVKRIAENSNGTILIGIVPGGANDTSDVQWRRNFGPGLDAYRKARDEGLQPDHSTLESVDGAHKRVKSQEAALKALKQGGMDIDNIKTTPGVNRDV